MACLRELASKREPPVLRERARKREITSERECVRERERKQRNGEREDRERERETETETDRDRNGAGAQVRAAGKSNPFSKLFSPSPGQVAAPHLPEPETLNHVSKPSTPIFQGAKNVDRRLPEKGNSIFHGARPVFCNNFDF